MGGADHLLGREEGITCTYYIVSDDSGVPRNVIRFIRKAVKAKDEIQMLF